MCIINNSIDATFNNQLTPLSHKYVCVYKYTRTYVPIISPNVEVVFPTTNTFNLKHVNKIAHSTIIHTCTYNIKYTHIHTYVLIIANKLFRYM